MDGVGLLRRPAPVLTSGGCGFFMGTYSEVIAVLNMDQLPSDYDWRFHFSNIEKDDADWAKLRREHKKRLEQESQQELW